MPFTFSHPAIVLPLTYLPRKWFSLTGLVVGSVTPDFEYFLRMSMNSRYSHSIAGLFWFDLPFGLLLAFAFHNLVRDQLFDNLPIGLKSRFSGFKQLNWNQHVKSNGLVVAISILIGAASHLFWDGFTHEHGYFVRAIPSLATPVEMLGRQAPVWKILQHASTLTGALVIAVALVNLPAAKTEKAPIPKTYWAVVAGLTLAILAARLCSGLEWRQYGHLVVTTISAGLISLAITPWLIRAKKG